MVMEEGFTVQQIILLAEPIFVLYYLMEGSVSADFLARNQLEGLRKGYKTVGNVFPESH
jgi:hypothetical protein